MKMKKLVLACSSLLAISALASCAGPKSEGDLYDIDYKLGNPGQLAEGFTDLANKNANGAIDSEGYYTAGGQKFKVKDTFKTTYATEPDDAFFNYLINTWTYNSFHYCNMVDGLVENDKYGNIVGAIALGYKSSINADGSQTWTFQLRENAEWCDNETGKKVANVTANDFVSGAKYVLNPANASGTTSLLTQWIKGAAEYSEALGEYQADPSKEAPDFASVGVKAVSDYVLEYTLIEPTPYFLSVLTYSPYLPVYEQFVEEEGTEFGKTVNDILVNGAFRITEHTFQDKMVYAKNFHYYDRDHVYVKHVERKFVPGEATLDTTRTWFEAGLIDSFTVNEDDEAGWNAYVKGAEGTGTLKNPAAANCNAIQSYGDATYVGYFNFNRTFYEYEGGITKSDAQKRDAAKAVLNKHFRNGFLWGMDVIKYLKRFSSDEPQNYLMRGFTNKELDSANGKDYTDYVNDEFNKNQGTTGVSLVGIDNGSDPVYNTTKALAAFTAARTELAAEGVSFPVYIDYIGSRNAQLQVYEREMIASLEEASKVGGEYTVKINYNVPKDATQNTNWGSVKDNFDFSMWSGWGPDYADPNTYLHCYCIYGDMLKHNGLPTDPTQLGAKELGQFLPQKYQDLVTGSGDNKDYSAAIKKLQEDALGAYDAAYKIGAGIVDPTKKVERFEKFAEAEYKLIFDESIVIPWYSQNGYYASVSKTIPWQAGRATYGLTSDKYKNVIVTEDAITKDQRKAVTDEYDAGK